MVVVISGGGGGGEESWTLDTADVLELRVDPECAVSLNPERWLAFQGNPRVAKST